MLRNGSLGSDVKQEIHHIAILDDVFLAFGTHLACILRALFAFVGDEVVKGNGLGTDETTLVYTKIGRGDRRCI